MIIVSTHRSKVIYYENNQVPFLNFFFNFHSSNYAFILIFFLTNVHFNLLIRCETFEVNFYDGEKVKCHLVAMYFWK